jgi:FimV-like protein
MAPDGITEETMLLELAQLYLEAGDTERAREVLIELEVRDANQRQLAPAQAPVRADDLPPRR